MFTSIRLKILRFFRRNSKIIWIAIGIFIVVFIVNSFLKSYEPEPELQTTYEPHTSVIDNGDTVPKKAANEIEKMIDEYVSYCNNADWQAAFDMLSEPCKEYGFDNKVQNFMDYVHTKMPTEKKYAIQDYSNEGNTYIYQIKYTDDLLATGLTNSVYEFTEEKMIFKRQKDGSFQMAVGNFVDFDEINNISENNYVKVDVKSVIKFYSVEKYIVKFTNRSDYTVVMADRNEKNEILLKLDSGDTRKCSDEIVLEPNESKTMTLTFQKFYDNGDDANSLSFGIVRVMENYSGIQDDEVVQSEIQNSISKFSLNIPVK